MATRDKPNSYFAWYNDDDRLAIVEKQLDTNTSKGIDSGEYDSFYGTTVTDGIRMTIHSKYEEVTAITTNLDTTHGLDSSMHASVLDYVKSRVSEDMGQMEQAQFFRTRFEASVSKKTTRRSGVRFLSVPKL